MKKLLLTIIIIIAILPNITKAAWVGTENFDSYSTGASLTGSGGSGWLSGWSSLFGAGSMTTETALSGGTGGIAAQSTDTTVSKWYRRLTSSVTDGTVSFEMRTSINNPNDFMGVFLRDNNGDGKMYIKFDSSGNIQYYDGDLASYQTIQAYSVDTWYRIYIQFDDITNNNKYRVRVGCGSWSSWVGTNGVYSDIKDFVFDMSPTNAHTFQADDIRDGSTDCSVSNPGKNNIIIFD